MFIKYEDENISNDVRTWIVEKIQKNIEMILNGMNDVEKAAGYSALYSWLKNVREQKVTVFYKELKILMEKEAAERNGIDISSKQNSDWIE